MNTSNSEKLLRILSEAISRRCGSFGWRHEADPDLIDPASFPRRQGTASEGGPSFSLPPLRITLRIASPRYTVLLAYLERQESGVDLVPALTWAGLVRSRLPAAGRADLHLYLVAAPSGATLPAWRRNRTTIENDERFCRKLLWLAPEDITDARQSADKFLERTVFSALWADLAPQQPRSLDPLLQVSQDLNHASLGIERREVEAWLSQLSAPTASAGDLAQKMIGALEEEG